MKNCIYVSSFASRPGSFGDYSKAFKNVLDNIFTTVVVCDVEPWVDVNDWIFDGKGFSKYIKETASKPNGETIIFVEHVQYHAIAWLAVRKLKQIVPSAKVWGLVHDTPIPFKNIINAYLPSKIWKIAKIGRIIDVIFFEKIIGNIIGKQTEYQFFLSEAGLKTYNGKWSLPTPSKLGSISHVRLVEPDALPKPSDKDDVFSIFYTGSWWKHKGMEVLIESLKLLHENFRIKAKLVMSGKCDDQVYQKSIEDALHKLSEVQETEYVGYQSFDEIYKTSSACHCWVIPYEITSKTACSGIMNLAISYGSCVVASDLPQFKEIITDNENGRLFNVGDAQDLALKLSGISEGQSEKLADKMAKEYLESISPFSVAKMITKKVNDSSSEK